MFGDIAHQPVGVQQPVNRIIFDGDLVRVGLFRCRPWHDLFKNDEQASAHHLVFPRTAVIITHDGYEPVITDPNTVLFYNKHQTYQREKLSETGDFCEYFSFSQEALLDTMRAYDPTVLERPERPYPTTHAPSDAHTFLVQRLVVEHILADEPVDALYVQEAMLGILARVLDNLFPGRHDQPETAAARRAHADLARGVKTILATRYCESLTLAEIARELYTSPYHLCRVFGEQAGQTIHRYRNQLRLRVGLTRILEGEDDLANLALALGYNSHSHFTRAFRKLFQATPSTLRSVRAARLLDEMSNNLTA